MSDELRSALSEFDGVVMLTWSNWYSEMRSNRYHYATRFARDLPVLFVQPELCIRSWFFEKTEIPNIRVLQVYKAYGAEQSALLNEAIASAGIKRPLFWAYNFLFDDFYVSQSAALKIYHATEDYFCDEFYPVNSDEARLDHLGRMLAGTDLLVGVSRGVLESYVNRGGYNGPTFEASNGCDYSFWNNGAGTTPREQNVAFYQGGIHQKLDFELLTNVCQALPDWIFWFCGEAADLPGWRALKEQKNVRYFGKLSPERVRQLALTATVGIIPFVQNDWIVNRSFPLKAFEYLAAGLPVVSVPINALQPYANVINFASSSRDFTQAIRGARQQLADVTLQQRRRDVAKLQDYDIRFANVIESATALARTRKPKIVPPPVRPLSKLPDPPDWRWRWITIAVLAAATLLRANKTQALRFWLDLAKRAKTKLLPAKPISR